jgi:hypothetical protein
MKTIPCKLDLNGLIKILTFFAGISDNEIMEKAIFADKETRMRLAKLGKSMHATFKEVGMEEEESQD